MQGCRCYCLYVSSILRTSPITITTTTATFASNHADQFTASAAPSASGTLSAKYSGIASMNATVNASIPLTTAHASTSVFVYTTASFDSSCSCTKTAAITTTAVSGPTGVVTSGTATGTGALVLSTGAAGKNEMGRLAAVAVVVGGLFAAM